MQSIMWLLVLLIALFFSGMLLLSNLNLNYSQKALSELRRDQIRDVFFASLTRIDARQQALERQTSALSLMGETFYRLASQSPQSDAARQQLRAQLDQALRHHLKNSDGASGAGIWFEPGILAPADESYASYFVQDKPGGGIQGVKRGRTTPHYRQAPWFNLIFGEHWQDDHPPGERVYWSPVYFDFTNARAVLTLARPMFSADHRLIGVVTTDWAAARIIDLVSRVTVTDHSFTFLNDRNNRNLSSLAQGKDTVLEQRLIDAILGQHLSA
ncbi:MAG: cache domain-containing protein, partial [Marinobacter sp.]|nr:cache domain-containing protein [Marinobacter sp.]